jgi:hypothetical protein
VIWAKDRSTPQFIRYAPEWVLDELALLHKERRTAKRQAAA